MRDRIRRTPDAIIKSFEMDPDKKAIYVEGSEDRLFFEYLYEEQIENNTIIFEIETVDLPNVEFGGNKQRLLEFAAKIDTTNAKIKCFVDADFSRILSSKQFPKAVIFTDFRDLEAYLYEKKYLTKFIKIGLKTDKLTPDIILDEISNAREIAILRLFSQEKELNLPFQKTNENFSKYYDYNNGINIKKYKTSLIQNSTFKPNKVLFEKTLEDIKSKCKSIDDRNLIHGKDVIEIVKIIATSLKRKKNNIELVFWMSFDKNDIEKYPALKQIKEFII